jgi:enoyl-CoA hydratase/carnithine racemase
MPAASHRVEVAEGVATLTLDRPEKLNALNRALLSEFGAALDQVQADPAVGVLVLTGAGERGLEREAALFALACAGEDMLEDTRAFLEKRPARFLGR